MDTLKLHIEVGVNKFNGEGPADLVKELYQAFLSKVGDLPVNQIPQTPAAIFKDNPPLGYMDGLYARVFVERDGVVSLQVLPKTEDAEGDALLMLLHGYQRLKPAEYPVTAVRLMQVAKLSGVNIERLDRALVSKSDLLMKAGFKRSTRYSLNMRGEQHALDLMKRLFE